MLAGGGEFGVALLSLLARGRDLPAHAAQPLLATVVLGMIASPLIIRYNRRIARILLREMPPPGGTVQRDNQAAIELARREHVVLCGFGRVGRNLGRVLLSQGFEYLGVDIDPANVRAARQAGEPIIWGDSADEDLLHGVGMDRTSVVIITFADPAVAIGVVQAVRRLRADVPVLVRTQDDARLADLSRAGATEVVPETFEASLTLVSQALRLLQLPAPQVTRVVDTLRTQRYATLRTEPGTAQLEQAARRRPSCCARWCCRRGAWAVGRRLEEMRGRAAPKSHSPRSAAMASPGASRAATPSCARATWW